MSHLNHETAFGAHPPHAGAIAALVLDDSDFDRARLCRIGRNSGLDIEISGVPTIAAMEQRLDAQDFDLVLIDYRLSEGDGLDALERVKAHHRNHAAAKVMVTGNGRTDLAVAAMRNGCDDYLDKTALTPDVFRARMAAALGRVVAIGEERMAAALSPDRLRDAFMAAFDPATLRDLLGPALLPTLVDGVKQALRESGVMGQVQDETELERLMRSFLQPDGFSFRS